MSKDLFKAFGIGDMPKLVQDAMGGSQATVAATLHSVTPGTRTDITAGTKPTEVDYTCRGFIDFQNQRFQSEGGQRTLVDNGQLVIVLFGNSINSGNTAPKPGDKITIEGTQYHIPDDGEVDRDPASVTYTCEVRKI